MLKRVGMTGSQATFGLIFTFAAILINFAFQVVAGRYLGPSEFSVLSVTLVFLATAGIAASGLQVVVAKSVASAPTSGDSRRFIDRYTMTALVIFGAAGLAIDLSSPMLSNLFNAPLAIFLGLGVFMPIAALFAIVNGRLQGKQRLIWVTLFGLFLGLAKFASTLFVIYAGGSVVEIVLVVVFVSGILVLLGFYFTRTEAVVNVSALSRESWTAVSVQVIFWLILTADVVIARVMMSGNVAGGFAVADTFAKVSLLAPSLILIVLLPRVAARRAAGKSARKMMLDALAVTLGLMLPPAILLALFGKGIIEFIFGDEYQVSSIVISVLAIATIPLGLASVLLQYHLASNDYKYAFRLALVLVVTILGFICTSSSLLLYCLCLLIGGVATVLVLLPRRAYSARKMQSYEF